MYLGVNFNSGKFVLLVFADGQPTNHQSTVMTTSTNKDSITTNIRQWNECLNWFILHLDHDLLQSEGDWSVPNLSAFVCHSVRNWWETTQAESLPHRDIKQMRKTAAGSFSLYQFHQKSGKQNCSFSFIDITNWKSESVVDISVSFPLSWGWEMEYVEWCWWFFLGCFELLCKTCSLNAGLAWAVFTPSQSSSWTPATFVCLVFPLFSCFSHPSPHGFTHPTL